MSSKRNPPDNTGKTYKKNKHDKRITLFKKYYCDAVSDTFQNTRGSALRAGYSETYASNLTKLMPKWYEDIQDDMSAMRASLLAKSEKHFKEVLDVPLNTDNKEHLKMKNTVALHVSETIGKELYSKRQELTDKGGKRLFNNESKDATESTLAHMFKGVQAVEDAT